jgi:integrase/recombinase XerD
MKSATIRFELRTDRGSNDKYPIVVRLYANRKNKYLNTVFKVGINDWSDKTQRTFEDRAINSYLDGISQKFNMLLAGNPTINNVEQIAKTVLGYGADDEIKLYDYIDDFVETKKKKNDVIKKTISRYNKVRETMADFLKDNKKEAMLLTDVNSELVNLFDAYMKYNLKVKDKPLQKNTINKYHSNLRTILLQAFNEGKIKSNPYKFFKIKHKPSNRLFLSEDELLLLKNKTFDLERNEKVRLIYLFSCYTGIRFEDAQQLSKSNLVRNSNGDVNLSFISNKAKKQQEVPIINDAIAVIDEMAKKFKDELSITNKLLPQISNQKFNDYLKAVAVRAGIDKELTHHTARHTFATYMLNRGVAPTALQALLGHSNIRETMLYAKITPGYLKKEIVKGN